MKPFVLIVIASALSEPSFCQKPMIDANGVVNAANYGRYLAPGSIGSIFGRNLSPRIVSADGTPLPTQLDGTSVQINGVNAPLFFVSPGQVNFQVPTVPLGAIYASAVAATVTTSAGTSDQEVFYYLSGAPGIFTPDQSGCGQGAVLNVKPDGTWSVNSPDSSAEPGDFLVGFATGFGVTYTKLADGYPAPLSPPVITKNVPVFYFDADPSPFLSTIAGYGTKPNFGGLSPGFVGLDQFNAQVPPSVREGCSVPLVISTDLGLSQRIPISIRRGGGKCGDPAIESSGTVVLTKTMPAGASESEGTESISAQFDAWPQKHLPLWGFVYTRNLPQLNAQVPFCPIKGYSNPTPGQIVVSGPRLNNTMLTPQTLNGVSSYQGQLPSGSLGPGSFSVAFSGNSSVGGFSGNIVFGDDIQLVAMPPAGTIFHDFDRALTFNWTGGTSDQQVMFTFISHQSDGPAGYSYINSFAGPADAHSYTIRGNPYLPINSSENLEILIDVLPADSNIFIAHPPEITQGVAFWGVYRHQYTGYKMRAGL